jgi:hypothetical protein
MSSMLYGCGSRRIGAVLEITKGQAAFRSGLGLSLVFTNVLVGLLQILWKEATDPENVDSEHGWPTLQRKYGSTRMEVGPRHVAIVFWAPIRTCTATLDWVWRLASPERLSAKQSL